MADITQQNDQESQLKEFLSRAEIRTMRKDLQKLRENIALKQRDQIVKTKTPEDIRQLAEVERTNLDKIKQEQAQKTELERRKTAQTKIAQTQTAEEIISISQIKESATEEERQQIFYLETEKGNLEKELLVIQREKEPPLLLRKNRDMLERNDIEEKLKAFLDEEKRLEQEQKFIEESEKSSNVAQDKKDLEKKRWSFEAEREGLEKKRWSVEKDLQTAEEKMKITEEEYQKLLAEQKTLREKITTINESIRSTYGGIMLREQENIKAKKGQRNQEAVARAEIEAKKKEEVRRQEQASKEIPGVENIKDDQRKEKLAKMMHEGAAEEENERQKFLKRIDEWAEEDKIQKNSPN